MNNDPALRAGSPAIGAGLSFSFAKTDFYGNPYNKIRNIGAVDSIGGRLI